jgi:phosphonatase-like hydrolase
MSRARQSAGFARNHLATGGRTILRSSAQPRRDVAFALAVMDMAGTTVFDGDAVNLCLRHAIGNVAGQDPSRDAVNRVMGISKPVAIAQLINRPGPDDPLVQDVLVDFQERMLGFYRTSPQVREIPGATDTFRLLRAQGIRVVLDTGFSRPIADAVLRRLGWDGGDQIDGTVTVDDVTAGRPAPYMIFRAMELTGVIDVRAVIKVGDTPVDLLEGDNARCGMVVGVTEGSHTAEQLLEYPHTALIPTIRALPGLIASRGGQGSLR